MKQEINTLLTKKMDRKDFLKHVGVGIVALTGVSAMLKALSPMSGTSLQPKTDNASYGFGYGSSAYGGQKNS